MINSKFKKNRLADPNEWEKDSIKAKIKRDEKMAIIKNNPLLLSAFREKWADEKRILYHKKLS